MAASTQNQALSALLFLHRHVLQLTLDERIDAIRAKPSRKLPTVLTPIAASRSRISSAAAKSRCCRAFWRC
ncbi:MAG: hypothetical protein ACFB0C_17700 [Leptolyngbyaceae cyanobacterium]